MEQRQTKEHGLSEIEGTGLQEPAYEPIRSSKKIKWRWPSRKKKRKSGSAPTVDDARLEYLSDEEFNCDALGARISDEEFNYDALGARISVTPALYYDEESNWNRIKIPDPFVDADMMTTHMREYLDAEAKINGIEEGYSYHHHQQRNVPLISATRFCGPLKWNEKEKFMRQCLDAWKELIQNIAPGLETTAAQVHAKDFTCFLESEEMKIYMQEYVDIYKACPKDLYQGKLITPMHPEYLKKFTEIQLKLSGFIQPKVEVFLPSGGFVRRTDGPSETRRMLTESHLELSGFIQPKVQRESAHFGEWLFLNHKVEQVQKYLNELCRRREHHQHLLKLSGWTKEREKDEMLTAAIETGVESLKLECRKLSEERDKKETKSNAGADNNPLFDKGKLSTETEHIAVRDCAVSNEEISRMANNISSCSKTIDIEFSDCDLRANHLEHLGLEIRDETRKITTLVISYMNGINELLGNICLLVKKFGILTLSFEYDNLNDQSINLFQKHLKDKEIKSLACLDISYNKNISSGGYKLIGEIMREFHVISLRATDCNITDDKLQSFFVGLHGCKLKELDIGRNTKLTAKGFGAMATFVESKRLQCLKLSGCDLSRENIDVFHKLLPQAGLGSLLEELDVSYNATIEPDTSLGSVVVKCGVTKLSMAGCKLDEDHLVHFGKLTNTHELTAVNMRDNSTIREGIVEIAKLVKDCKLKELNICDCMLSAQHLKLFSETLDGTKLKCLHLGDRNREPEADYINETCKILMNVDVLHLRFPKLSDVYRYHLQEHSTKCSVEIILTLGSKKEIL